MKDSERLISLCTSCLKKITDSNVVYLKKNPQFARFNSKAKMQKSSD